MDEVFVNPYTVDLEGTYVFPLPEGAAVDKFSLKVDGVPVDGEMLDADEAAGVYRELVRENRDPALLEYVGREAFRCRIYPIPAEGEKRVEISYTEVLPYDGGTVKYEYPLDTERFSVKPLEDVDVTVNIRADGDVKTVYSPSHELDVEMLNDGTGVEARYHAKDAWPDRDLVLYYVLSNVDIAANLITHKPEADDGYFLMLVTPPAAADKTETAKEISFVMDTSGSMAGESIEQVKDALAYYLNRLGERDRFNLITFSETVRRFRETTVPATKSNVKDALDFARAIEAAGGTNINDALLAAVSTPGDAERTSMVVFLTDGKPTVGEKDTLDIIDNVTGANAEDGARLFVFGAGYKVNTDLLDGLSRENGGLTRYVEPGEDIELAVTRFYDKIASPVLSDVEIDWGGGDVYDVYPPETPDVFAGTQLIVMGRYEGGAPSDVTITGARGGENVGYAFVGSEITGSDDDNPFIAPLWAARKIGYLLEEIRLGGEDEELVDAVIALSKEYGIVTPYTSYLVEDTAPKTAGVTYPRTWGGTSGGAAEDRAGWLGGAATFAARDGGGVPAPGWNNVRTDAELSVKESRVIGGMKEVTIAVHGAADGQLRYVGERAFAFENGFWVDLSIGKDRGDYETVEVTFGSDEYFELLASEPRLAEYLALGEQVEVLWGGRLYKITL
ncbi:MAG: VWA domain-containing protein [Candidatus Coatesbacteria bacterium]|nr:MAG: VWA domain-containing protein [Candidatus Coatesbacteria bacterium]